jgi:hypothetical protein
MMKCVLLLILNIYVGVYAWLTVCMRRCSLKLKFLYIDVNKRNITHEMPFTIEGILLLLCDHNLYIQYATNNI